MAVLGLDWQSFRSYLFQRLSLLWQCPNMRPWKPLRAEHLRVPGRQWKVWKAMAHSLLQRPWLQFKGKGGWADSRPGQGAIAICWNGHLTEACHQASRLSQQLKSDPCPCRLVWFWARTCLSTALCREEDESAFAFCRANSCFKIANFPPNQNIWSQEGDKCVIIGILPGTLLPKRTITGYLIKYAKYFISAHGEPRFPSTETLYLSVGH